MSKWKLVSRVMVPESGLELKILFLKEEEEGKGGVFRRTSALQNVDRSE